MVSHEVSDLVTGAVVAPFIIFYAARVASPRRNPISLITKAPVIAE
jgi:hypothetical protein